MILADFLMRRLKKRDAFMVDATVNVTLTIQTPTSDFSGPIDLQFTAT